MPVGGNHIGAETTISARGLQAEPKDWKISRWDRKIWKLWLEWAKKEFPDPVASIRAELQKYAYEDQVTKASIQLAQQNPDRDAGLATINELAMKLAANHDIEKLLADKAVEAAGKVISLASPKAFELINSPEGSIYLLYLLLQEHHQGTTEDEAAAIFIEKGQEEIQKTFDLAAGTPPIQAKKNGEEISKLPDLGISQTP